MSLTRNGLWPLVAVAIVSGCVQSDAPRPGVSRAPSAATLPAPALAVKVHAEHRPPQPAELVKAIREDPDPIQRSEAVYALADADIPDAAAVIGQAMTDPDAEVRSAAIVAMTGVDEATAADWLSVGLGDPDPRVRRTAVEALGHVGGASAPFLLQQALGDADAGVREAAQQMLEEPEFSEPAVSRAFP